MLPGNCMTFQLTDDVPFTSLLPFKYPGSGLGCCSSGSLARSLKLSLADQPDLLPRRHGEALEQRSLDDEAIAILLLEGSDDIKVDCDDLRYGPTTPGGQAQLTASLFFCIPSSLFISRLVE